MPDSNSPVANTWNVLVVEDDENVRRQIREYLEGEQFASRHLNISDITDLAAALNVIRERKADLIILDVYRGTAALGGERTGVQILESIKKSGFVPVILYTALPEGLDSHRSSFVRLVGKEAGGLDKLKEEIGELFRMKVPQLHRSVVDHLDQSLCTYMWSFVQEHWIDFEEIVDKPEFLRLVIQRLAMTFSRQGIGDMIAAVYGVQAPGDNPDSVHPAEYYVKPPIGTDPLLGDLRVRENDGGKTHIVVLWPSCDMVSANGRTAKTDWALCATATPLSEMGEVREWSADRSDSKKKKVKRLLSNNRDTNFGSADRYHFLPGVWDFPDLVVDFQALEHVRLSELRGLNCLATVASPFAESLAARFQRYIGRLGTPDLNHDVVLGRLESGGVLGNC
ncbi:MAG: response regulator [Candidatus Zixiibacteriota bacterium]